MHTAQGMLPFLHTVRDIVVPRLKSKEERIRAWQPELHWAKWESRRPSFQSFLDMLLQGLPQADTLYPAHGVPADHIWLYSDAKWDKAPFGQMVAFALIHELAHTYCWEHGHESVEWQDACRAMGICETIYSEKRESGKYLFKDELLLAKIRALHSYPGDEP